MSDNVITLNPRSIEDLPKNEREDIVIRNRDEMLEVLDGIRGRIEGLEMVGIILIGLSNIPGNDIIFSSAVAEADPTRSVGMMEMTKHAYMKDVISDQLDD